MNPASALFHTALASVLLASQAQAWDAGGHMLTAQIAWERMRPEVRAKVSALVAKLPNEYNAGQPYNFVTAPTWMDDMRSMPKYPWSKLHYVTLEYTATGSPIVIPEPPHILSAMDESIAALKSAATPEDRRVEALGMLVHFVGDIHQPLHATDWAGDRGGNGYLITGIPFSDLMPKMIANLHTFWDKAYRFDTKAGKPVEEWRCPEIKDRPKLPGQGIIAEQARDLMLRFPEASLFQLADKGGAVAWARESHLIGCLAAYPQRPYPAADEPVVLPPEFIAKAHEIAGQRVTLAGYRMGNLLNEIFGAAAKP
jgi:S1/P1 Nuclease